jgi:hypothetical protein
MIDVRQLIHRPRQSRWVAQRALVDRLRSFLPYRGTASRRVLFVTHAHPICASQIFPFFHYSRQLRERFDVELREINLEAFEAATGNRTGAVDIVCLQTCFDFEPERMQNLLKRLRSLCRPAKIVFLDSFAPTDLRMAELLDDHVDIYVKKHVLRDRSRYGEPTLGDTNLTEYCGRRYGIEFPETPSSFPRRSSRYRTGSWTSWWWDRASPPPTI